MYIRVKPVKTYKTPSYPDMEKAAANPDLLKKLPERWRYNKAVIAAIIALSSLSLAGCNTELPDTVLIDKETSISFDKSEDIAKTENDTKTEDFTNTDVGLLAGVPQMPTFITEEEALSIIKNEALKYGVNLDDKPIEKSISNESNCVESDCPQVSDMVLAIDVLDKEKEIAVAYYEHGDNRLYYEKSPDEGIPYNLGFFNFPYQDIIELEYKINQDSTVVNKQETIEKERKALIEEDLRAQVKDFIEWLRGQGVI